MIDRLRFATALTMGLLACGGRVGDESPLSEGAPGAPPQTRGGGERPGRDGFRPPPSSNGGGSEDRPQLPRAPMVGESAPAGEASSGAPAPVSDLDCAPGASRCNGARLEQCSPEAGWFLVARCGVSALCDATQGRCLVDCIPGASRCNGAQVEQCNADATAFEVIDVCKSAGLCLGDSDQAACVNACERGETRCIGPGPQLGRCNDDLTGYELVEDCSARCDAVLCGPGASVDAGAAPVDPDLTAGADPGGAPSEDPGAGPSPDPGAAASAPSTEPAVPSTDPGADPGNVPGADPTVPSPDPVVPSADAGVDVAAE
jgi:hypothetical protein